MVELSYDENKQIKEYIVHNMLLKVLKRDGKLVDTYFKLPQPFTKFIKSLTIEVNAHLKKVNDLLVEHGLEVVETNRNLVYTEFTIKKGADEKILLYINYEMKNDVNARLDYLIENRYYPYKDL